MAASKPSRPVQVLLALLALVAVIVAGAQQLSSAEPVDKATAKLLAQMVQEFHINRPKIDDAASSRFLDTYLKDLDPLHLYFLQSDVDSFASHRTTLDDELTRGDVDFGYQVYDLYRSRVLQQCDVADRMIDVEYDFSIADSKPTDYSKLNWARTPEELNERWEKMIKLELLVAHIDGDDMAKLRDDLHKRYRNVRRIVKERSTMEVLEVYLSAFTKIFDPHSSYMSPQAWEDFEIDLKLSLDGIGASLKSDDGFVIVHQIVPHGAADKDGRLKAGDRITGVGQIDARSGKPTEIVDTFEMKLTDVVRMIRGERGTKVVLRVEPEGKSETLLYEITREKIELDASECKGEVIDTTDRLGRPGKIGLISLPSFYRDFAGDQAGEENFKSAAADMAVFLNEFRAQGVDAVVVDMRHNTGGALSEAIEVTGHFIDRGPVVQVRQSAASGAKVLEDELQGVLWSGPLVLVCDRWSASATEIFAGAIKDYQRGIVVGDTTTHGKGTVQNLMDVSPNQMFRLFGGEDRGKLKLTIQQFYRVNGDSTQHRGVRSDIVLPSLLDHADSGESSLENALPFNSIAAARFVKNSFVTPDIISTLAQSSARRVAANADFQKLGRAIQRYLDRKNRPEITLNEAELRAERAQDELEDEGTDPEEAAMEEALEASPDRPIFPQSFYNDEVLNITLDYVELLQNRVTARN